MDNELYIITGAAGHLGSTLVKILRANNISVRALMLPADQAAAARIKALGAEVFFGDMQDIKSLRPLFSNLKGKLVTAVHCAGIISIATKDDKRLRNVNVGGTINMLALCKSAKVQRLVHVSSVHAIPEPKGSGLITEVKKFAANLVHGFYAKSKAEATNIVLEKAARGLNVSVVHPSGILGPDDYGQGLLTGMAVEFLNGRMPAGVRGGYDFVDVRDVAKGIISCAKNGKAGECYILSGHYVTIKELLDLLAEITHKPPVRFLVPMWMAKMVAPLSELSAKLQHHPPLFTPYSLYTLGTIGRFSHKKATAELAYNPRSLRETLTDMVGSLKEQKRV